MVLLLHKVAHAAHTVQQIWSNYQWAEHFMPNYLQLITNWGCGKVMDVGSDIELLVVVDGVNVKAMGGNDAVVMGGSAVVGKACSTSIGIGGNGTLNSGC
uniref:Uncharacterized protein n=1 Tax=Romanomermis culicivorax TaxID=13658 RepID=A0A915L4G8_ROMCU